MILNIAKTDTKRQVGSVAHVSPSVSLPHIYYDLFLHNLISRMVFKLRANVWIGKLNSDKYDVSHTFSAKNYV